MQVSSELVFGGETRRVANVPPAAGERKESRYQTGIPIPGGDAKTLVLTLSDFMIYKSDME
jgi:hypothetical protein